MKIAYIGEHHPTEGTYYRQRITVNRAEFNEINAVLSSVYNKTKNDVNREKLMTSAQMGLICYGQPLDPTKNKHYLKLTQLYIIAAHVKNKRLRDLNTILLIKE